MAADNVESMLVTLTKAFSPGPVYQQIDVMMAWTYTNLTGPLLAVAVALRTFTEMHANTTGNSRWGQAVKDMVTYTAVIILYTYAANEVLNYVYVLEKALGHQSGMDRLLDNMSFFFEKINTASKAAADKKNWWDMTDFAASVVAQPFLLIAWGVFFISLIILLALEIVARVALAIALGLGEVYGLIAIPISVAGGSLKLMGGWALLVAGVLMWPFVEDYLSWMAGGVITNVMDSFIAVGDINNVNTSRVEVYLAYTIINVFLSAIIIMSPLIAEKLVSNRSSLASFAMPMLGAAGLAAKEIGSRVVNTVTDRARTAASMGGVAVNNVVQQGAQQLLDWKHLRSPLTESMSPTGPRAASAGINIAPGAVDSYGGVVNHHNAQAGGGGGAKLTPDGPGVGARLGMQDDIERAGGYGNLGKGPAVSRTVPANSTPNGPSVGARLGVPPESAAAESTKQGN